MPKYNVCFQRGAEEYIWRTYKTYGGARRYITSVWGTYGFTFGHNFDGWAIEREVNEHWSNTCVLAQSKSWRHKTRYRNRNFADRWPVNTVIPSKPSRAADKP